MVARLNYNFAALTSLFLMFLYCLMFVLFTSVILFLKHFSIRLSTTVTAIEIKQPPKKRACEKEITR